MSKILLCFVMDPPHFNKQKNLFMKFTRKPALILLLITAGIGDGIMQSSRFPRQTEISA